jgi:hypothetical protein
VVGEMLGNVAVSVGLVWAVLGVGNILLGFWNVAGDENADVWSTAVLLFNMLLFVLPGLAVAALGQMLRKRAG